jgi:hypothetical protein
VAAVKSSASGLPLPDSSSGAIRALSARLKDASARHLAELAGLRQALAEAHGENLQLRRRLAAYEDCQRQLKANFLVVDQSAA